MLVQPTEDEGEQSERPSEPQLTPSPPHPSEVHVEPEFDPSPRPLPTSPIPDSILESSGGNHGGQSSSDKSLSGIEGDMSLQSIKKLKKKSKPVITHHKAWMKSVSLKQRLVGNKALKKTWIQKESVSKQGGKSAKAEPTVHKDHAFDELGDDAIDIMETEDAQGMGRTRFVVHEEKEREEKEVSTDDALGTDKEKDSTDRPDEGTEGRSATPTTPTPTPTTFGDDETIAQVLLNMSQVKAVSREKEKGSLLTLKPLLKINPKDKGKKNIEVDESDTESEDVNETEKKFKMLAHNEEITRKMQEDWETKEERKRLAKEEATNDCTYLKHVGNKKHSDLKNKTFEEIQALYEKVKRFDESFTAVGSTEDERKIREMNKGAKDLEQKRLKKKVSKETPKKEDTSKVPTKVDVTEQGTKKRKGGHIKMLARKRKRPQSNVDSDDEHIKCLKIVTFEGTIDSEIMERKSVISRLNKVSSPDGDYLVIYRANGNFKAFNYLLELLHIFDRSNQGSASKDYRRDLSQRKRKKSQDPFLMTLPEDHLAKFHKMTDAKEMWDVIKSRFGGNNESKKMQKYILKQQFEDSWGGVSTEDANQNSLRLYLLLSSSLIMRTKPGVDSPSFDDLYNNLRVFENDVKGSTASSLSTQNVAFVSENTISINDVSTAYGVANPSGHNL
ncbi:hypothetical protein Tco_1033364 [Tanacetum coccineum]